MLNDTIVILGIPIDNVGMDEALKRVKAMIRAFKKDGKPRLIATVNVDFLVNALSWFSQTPKHPELLRILRHAHLVSADGMPIVWASWLLGTPLTERVTGSDMVPALAEMASKNNISVYLLGGMEGVAEKAAQVLVQKNPGLKIAGVDSPMVYISGERLKNWEKDDAPIVEKINRSKADVLLAAFGNPKQELWFERNRYRLKVPVTIGVGATFDFVAGIVQRAPVWMQNSGTEWLFRLWQEPMRLWKRYFVGFFKFGFMIFPVIIYHSYRRLIKKAIRSEKQSSSRKELPGIKRGDHGIEILTFSDPLDQDGVDELKNSELNNPLLGRHIILDLSDVTFIDSSGLGLIMRLWNQAREENRRIFLSGLKPAVRRTFQVSRMLGVFDGLIYDSVKEAVAAVRKELKTPLFHYHLSQKSGYNVLFLFGDLDAGKMKALNMGALMNKIGASHIITDLSNLDFLDSAGLMLFFKLHKTAVAKGYKCIFTEAKPDILRIISLTKLTGYFDFEKTMEDAVKRL